MASLSNSQTCIGLAVEGDFLKLAIVKRVRKKIHILDLASMPVQTHKFVNTTEQEEGNSETQIGFDTDQSEDQINYRAVRDFLQAHFKRQFSVAVAYGEPTIRTFVLSCESKERKSQTLDRILSEVQHLHNVELTQDMVDWVQISNTSILATARLEVAPLLDVFAMPAGTERRPMRINFVSSSDIALLNLVRTHYRFQVGDVTHVIYVGNDETKLYIMRGNNVVHIAPVIMQGSRDRDIASLLLTRLELAADSAGYPTPGHIVLAGHAERIGLRDLFNEVHPDVVIHALTRLRATTPSEEREKEISDYLLPISAAWQHIEAKNPHFYRTNVIPTRLREDQKKFKLAWHGLLLLLVLFGATTGLTIRGLQQRAQISELEASLTFEKQQIKEQQEIVARINSLEVRSADVIKATTTLDTLLNSAEKWSMTIDTLTNGVAKLQNMWIAEMKPTETGVTISGFSLNRKNIPNFSTLIGGAQINEVSVQFIKLVKVLRFVMDLNVPALPPHSTSLASDWHRNLSIPKITDSPATAMIPAASAPTTPQTSTDPKGGK